MTDDARGARTALAMLGPRNGDAMLASGREAANVSGTPVLSALSAVLDANGSRTPSSLSGTDARRTAQSSPEIDGFSLRSNGASPGGGLHPASLEGGLSSNSVGRSPALLALSSGARDATRARSPSSPLAVLDPRSVDGAHNLLGLTSPAVKAVQPGSAVLAAMRLRPNGGVRDELLTGAAHALSQLHSSPLLPATNLLDARFVPPELDLDNGGGSAAGSSEVAGLLFAMKRAPSKQQLLSGQSKSPLTVKRARSSSLSVVGQGRPRSLSTSVMFSDFPSTATTPMLTAVNLSSTTANGGSSSSGGAASRSRAPTGRPRSASMAVLERGNGGRSRSMSVSSVASTNPGTPFSASHVVVYTPEMRLQRIERFLEKRRNRIWRKSIKYDVRKLFADSRLRVKGRFVRKEDEEQLKELVSLT